MYFKLYKFPTLYLQTYDLSLHGKQLKCFPQYSDLTTLVQLIHVNTYFAYLDRCSKRQ